MVFDKDWHLEQFNSSAQKILGCSLVNYLECSIDKIPIISEKKINFGDSFKQNNEHQQRVDAFREDVQIEPYNHSVFTSKCRV